MHIPTYECAIDLSWALYSRRKQNENGLTGVPDNP